MLRPEHVKIGIAPIGWTNDDLPELGGDIPFEQCIDEMQSAGYQGCEVGNKFPRDPQQLQEALQPRGLQIASAWFSAFLTTQPLQETLDAFVEHRDFLHAMGAEVIVVSEQGHSIQGSQDTPLWNNEPQFSSEEWASLVGGLEELGKAAAEKDMEIVFHHHMGTGVQNPPEIHRLMAETDPQWVSLLLDTGHLAFAGGDSVDFIQRYKSRIKHVHFKDLREPIVAQVKADGLSFLDAVKAGVFTIPGDGMLAFEPIVQALGEIEYQGWIVVEAEQDPRKAPPLQYAKMARENIRLWTGL